VPDDGDDFDEEDSEVEEEFDGKEVDAVLDPQSDDAQIDGSIPDLTAGRALRDARDFLLDHRDDYDTAYRDFRAPRLETFNWAVDWFDGVLAAERPEQPALWLVEEDGSEVKLTFAEMSASSSQVAAWLRSQGVRRYDRILLMLGNQVELWEVLLAATKIGAVVIPASTLLGPDDLGDRIDRGDVNHVVARSVDTAKFADVEGGWTRIAVGAPVQGWLDYAWAYEYLGDTAIEGRSRGDDPLLLYFTSGTTARPKLVEHTHTSYPIGHLTTMYWLGVRPGDVHLNISSPGWAKHAWSNVFAPWNAGATVLVVNQARFNAVNLLDTVVRCGVTTFCAPPTVWRLLIQADLGSWKVPFRECVAAGEPLNPEVIEQVRTAWGLTARDGYGQTETTAQIGNTPGQPVKPGSMGRPVPGVPDHPGGPLDRRAHPRRRDRQGGRDLPRPGWRPGGPAGGPDEAVPRRGAGRGRDAARALPHRRCRVPGRGRVHHLRRAYRRRVQSVRLPDLAVRGGERADRARGRRRGGGGAGAGPGTDGDRQGVRVAGGGLPAGL
jgi:acetyl-CoA synthetase